MKKKLNKKLLNLIALCSGITATVGLGVGGVIYSLRQEKDGGDEPIDQNILPESVYDIDENNVLLGFKDEFLNNPDSEIYKDKFKDCDTMEIPAKVMSIASAAFEQKMPTFITKLTFAEGSNCSSIGNHAFYDCSSLTSIAFPSSLTKIGNSTFTHCSLLTSINLSNCTKLTTLNNEIFNGCSLLTSVTFPISLKEISGLAFKDCTSLTSIAFPSSLESIGARAFYHCSELNYIEWNLLMNYQSSITINSNAFNGISSTGTVKSLNTSIASQQLLEWIKTKGDFPSGDGWKVAD